ncbi:MAG: hypothetical protein ACXW4B_09205 [Micavibrio sp.]
MNRKVSAIFTALSLGSLAFMGYGYFNDKPAGSPASITTPAQAGASAQPAQSQPAQSATVDGVTLQEVNTGEAFGLLLLGAQNKERLATLSDPRDLCTVVKGNAILNNSTDLGESRFSQEFETCANRTLHYEASLMQAGGIIGVENISKMTAADFCGVTRLSVGRAMMKYALESGQTIPDHDTTLDNINDHLDECAATGQFALSDAVWNEYANQAIILPFYAPKAVAPAP